MMGQGRRNLAARMNASSWVLSPTSARATTPVETNRVFIAFLASRAGQERLTTPLSGLSEAAWSKVLPGRVNRLHHGREAKCVDAGPFFREGRLLPNDGSGFYLIAARRLNRQPVRLVVLVSSPGSGDPGARPRDSGRGSGRPGLL